MGSYILKKKKKRIGLKSFENRFSCPLIPTEPKYCNAARRAERSFMDSHYLVAWLPLRRSPVPLLTS